MNQAIRGLLDELNDRTMKHLGKSRRELFQALDRPALQALPERPYELATFRKGDLPNSMEDDQYYNVRLMKARNAANAGSCTSPTTPCPAF